LSTHRDSSQSYSKQKRRAAKDTVGSVPPLFNFWLELCTISLQTVQIAPGDTQFGKFSAAQGFGKIFAMLTSHAVYRPTQDLGGWQQKALTLIVEDLLTEFEARPAGTQLGLFESVLLASHGPFQKHLPRLLLLAFKVTEQDGETRGGDSAVQEQDAPEKFCCLLLHQHSKLRLLPELLVGFLDALRIDSSAATANMLRSSSVRYVLAMGVARSPPGQLPELWRLFDDQLEKCIEVEEEKERQEGGKAEGVSAHSLVSVLTAFWEHSISNIPINEHNAVNVRNLLAASCKRMFARVDASQLGDMSKMSPLAATVFCCALNIQSCMLNIEEQCDSWSTDGDKTKRAGCSATLSELFSGVMVHTKAKKSSGKAIVSAPPVAFSSIVDKLWDMSTQVSASLRPHMQLACIRLAVSQFKKVCTSLSSLLRRDDDRLAVEQEVGKLAGLVFKLMSEIQSGMSGGQMDQGGSTGELAAFAARQSEEAWEILSPSLPALAAHASISQAKLCLRTIFDREQSGCAAAGGAGAYASFLCDAEFYEILPLHAHVMTVASEQWLTSLSGSTKEHVGANTDSRKLLSAAVKAASSMSSGGKAKKGVSEADLVAHSRSLPMLDAASAGSSKRMAIALDFEATTTQIMVVTGLPSQYFSREHQQQGIVALFVVEFIAFELLSNAKCSSHGPTAAKVLWLVNASRAGICVLLRDRRNHDALHHEVSPKLLTWLLQSTLDYERIFGGLADCKEPIKQVANQTLKITQAVCAILVRVQTGGLRPLDAAGKVSGSSQQGAEAEEEPSAWAVDCFAGVTECLNSALAAYTPSPQSHYHETPLPFGVAANKVWLGTAAAFLNAQGEMSSPPQAVLDGWFTSHSFAAAQLHRICLSVLSAESSESSMTRMTNADGSFSASSGFVPLLDLASVAVRFAALELRVRGDGASEATGMSAERSSSSAPAPSSKFLAERPWLFSINVFLTVATDVLSPQKLRRSLESHPHCCTRGACAATRLLRLFVTVRHSVQPCLPGMPANFFARIVALLFALHRDQIVESNGSQNSRYPHAIQRGLEQCWHELVFTATLQELGLVADFLQSALAMEGGAGGHATAAAAIWHLERALNAIACMSESKRKNVKTFLHQHMMQLVPRIAHAAESFCSGTKLPDERSLGRSILAVRVMSLILEQKMASLKHEQVYLVLAVLQPTIECSSYANHSSMLTALSAANGAGAGSISSSSGSNARAGMPYGLSVGALNSLISVSCRFLAALLKQHKRITSSLACYVGTLKAALLLFVRTAALASAEEATELLQSAHKVRNRTTNTYVCPLHTHVHLLHTHTNTQRHVGLTLCLVCPPPRIFAVGACVRAAHFSRACLPQVRRLPVGRVRAQCCPLHVTSWSAPDHQPRNLLLARHVQVHNRLIWSF
jgi:hypothetical protein